MIRLEDLKHIYKEKIKEEKEKSDFLYSIYQELEKHKDQEQITKREVKKALQNLNLPENTIWKTLDDYNHTTNLYIRCKGETMTVTSYQDKDLTRTEMLLKGILREITYDYVAKYTEELKQLEHIYNEYQKAINILRDIKPALIKKEDYPTLRKATLHHDRHSYLLCEHLKILNEMN